MFKVKPSLYLALIPVLIAVLVGGLQIYLSVFKGLSAWQVGGFGMFARPDMKYVRVYVNGEPVDPAIGYERLIKKIDTLPTPANLRLLASSVACDYDKTTRVELWRGTFNTQKQGIDFWLGSAMEETCVE
jgi:hypothetical protein